MDGYGVAKNAREKSIEKGVMMGVMKSMRRGAVIEAMKSSKLMKIEVSTSRIGASTGAK